MTNPGPVRKYNVKIAPVPEDPEAPPEQPPSPPCPDPLLLLVAAALGMVGAIAADVGVAAACGAPLTGRDIIADIVGGGIGGFAGGIADALGASDFVIAIIGAFVAGFVTQALFPPSPIPPRAVPQEEA